MIFLKIDCDLKEDFFLCYDEVKGIVSNKKRILKNKKIIFLNYTQKLIFIFLIIFILSNLLLKINSDLYLISGLIVYLDSLFLLFSFIYLITLYIIRRKKNFESYIKLSEEGLIYESFYDIKMTFNWDKIIGIAYRKYAIVIFTDTPIYFFFPISKKDTLIESIKKYNRNIPIINLKK